MRWVVVVLLVLAGCGADETARPPEGSTTVAPPSEAGPGLLEVPDPLPDGPPGTVVEERVVATIDAGGAVDVHQVLYLSTDRFGAPTAVSGLVLVPVEAPEPPGGRAVVAWGHGTVGLTDCDAPSGHPDAGASLLDVGMGPILAAGHVVAASDYPGLGTPGVHPYLDGVGEGRAVLDSIRAARTLGAAGPAAAVVGFSQGSQASIFAGAEQPAYAPEVDLRGIVPIGVPSRFGLAFGAADMPVVQGYLGSVLAGILAARPDLDRSAILTEEGAAAQDAFAAEADLPGGACTPPDLDPDRHLGADPMTVPAWRAALAENDPGQRPVAAPVLVVQSEGDEQALAFLADQVCRDLEAGGTDVRMWRYDDEGHAATVTVSAADRATWVLDRLAGRPVTDAVAFTGERPEVLPTCPTG
ncbi:MAG TPA: lipase family protein [Iamia sp.]|nr:lipase family protein [Iamia sp.]